MIDHSKIDKYHAFEGIPAMTSPQVHAYLQELGSEWQGKGTVMELGCWLGASAVALLKGLKGAGYYYPFWAFDKWIVDSSQPAKAAAQGWKLEVGEDTHPLFLHNVDPVYDKVKSVQGGMPDTLKQYDGASIEICIFDAPKADPTFTSCVKALIPYWVPGVTILGLLDYDFYLRHQGPKREQFRAPVRFMEKYGSHFSIVKEWDDEAVKFFKYEKEIKTL